jgi:hypothetical protein
MASKIQFNKAIHFYLNGPFVNNNFAFMNKLLTMKTRALTVNKVT